MSSEASRQSEFEHVPVMLQEVLAAFAPVASGLVVDATVGLGGHSEALLETYPSLRLLGIDRDPVALGRSSIRLKKFGNRVTLVRGRSEDLVSIVRRAMSGSNDRVDGAFFDLGVSSLQLDDPNRGFSYRFDSRLDMRMDPEQSTTALEVVNSYPEEGLSRVLADFGDERYHRRVAKAIVSARPLTTTRELAEVIRTAIPAAARRRGGHPAKRSFQAIRIEVNQELVGLRQVVGDAIDLVGANGRVAVLTYHSGEDKPVAAAMKLAVAGDCTCPPRLPCVCGARPKATWVVKAARPSFDEGSINPRAASARLRVVQRLFDQEEAI